MNQYKSIFDQYNIVSYDNFQNDENLLSSNIACTILKTQEKKTQKKINVKKIITLKEVINKPIDLLKLKFNNLSELQKIKYLKKDGGKTSIKFELQNKQNKLVFDLKDKRKIDLKQLNSLKIKENLILD